MKTFDGQNKSKIIVFDDKDLNLFRSIITFCSSYYDLFGFETKSHFLEYLDYFE